MTTGELLMIGTTSAFVLSFLGYSATSVRARPPERLLPVVVALGFICAGQFALFSFGELVMR